MDDEPVKEQSVHQEPEEIQEANGEPNENQDQEFLEGEIDVSPDQPEDDQQEQKLDRLQDPRINHMCQHLSSLDDFSTEKLTPAVLENFYNFLETPLLTRLFVWLDLLTNDVCTNNDNPPPFFGTVPQIKSDDYQVSFFIKRSGTLPVEFSKIQHQVICGQIDGNPLDDLLNKMNAEYVPKLLGENDWPEGVKKEFQANLNKFMATITEESHMNKGRTYLYIPEEQVSDVDTAVKDKDLVQRLESTVIYWTRQIKELVSNQDAQNSSENNSPLDEIKYWNERNANLKTLTTRLKEPKLKKITDVLAHNNSGYLQNFRDLEEKIKEGFMEAEDNLMFLNLLNEPCRRMEQAQPKEIAKILPEVLNCVRIIWELSRFYCSNERMKGLLTKISNLIIKRCRQKINIQDMLGNNVEKCIQDLDECIECCKSWKEICTKSQNMITKQSTKRDYKFSEDEIFAENEAFIQRCKDLKEICEGQLQFALRGSNCRMPVFGGTKGKEWTVSLEDLKKSFDKHLEQIKNLGYDILDVKVTKWHDDYGQIFKERVKQIEVLYTVQIALTFKHVSTIEDAVEMLENFYQLARRPGILEYVKTKAAEVVYKLFMEEIKQVEERFDESSKIRPPMPYSHPHYGGLAIWVYSLIKRIDKAKLAIDGLYFIPEHKDHKEAIEKYTKLRLQLDLFITKTEFGQWLENVGQYQQQSEIDRCMGYNILIRKEKQTEKEEEVVTKAANALAAETTTKGNAPKGGDKKSIAAKATNALATDAANADKAQVEQKPAETKHRRKNEKDLNFLSRKITYLETNFDVGLLRTIIEMQYWQKVSTLGLNFPMSLSKLLNRKDQLRVLRESVMLIVRDYNNIINLLAPYEINLFTDHLKLLDKQIENGLSKINWQNNADAYIIVCRNYCATSFQQFKEFKKGVQKIQDELEIISNMVLTNIKKQLYALNQFMDIQAKEIEGNQKRIQKCAESIVGKFNKLYKKFFFEGSKEIQDYWLRYIHELDKQLEKALRSAVKNSLIDFQKHIKGDQQELVPIFRIYNLISNSPSQNNSDSSEWQVLNEPTHYQLMMSVQEFIKVMIQATNGVPRLEAVFRQQHQILVLQNFQEQKNQQIKGGSMSKNHDNQNLTEEEKLEKHKEKYKLPDKDKHIDLNRKYVTSVSENKDIKQLQDQILKIVEEIRAVFEVECRFWFNLPEVKQIQSMGTERGRNRFIKQQNQSNSTNGNGVQDPVSSFRTMIESIDEYVADIRNKPPFKNEQFIRFENSKMKQMLTESGNEFIQYILNDLITKSKKELNELCTNMQNTIEELKQHCTNNEQLKRNRERYAEVRASEHLLEAQIQPIKLKFAYIMDDDKQGQTIEISEQDKLLLASLDENWNKFKKGMVEANNIIQKSFVELKQEMDNQIDDFKKDVQENKQSFKNSAPFAVNKTNEFDNNKALDELKVWREYCQDARTKEEEMKFGLDIFDYEHLNQAELSQIEKENELLTKIWTYKDEFDKMWSSWKNTQFKLIDVGSIEDSCVEYQGKIQELQKDVRMWQIYTFMKTKLELFLTTLPMILDLQDESIRKRHWDTIRLEVKEEFDEKADDFTLEKIFELQLSKHQEMIYMLCENAKKQLKIEKALNEIKRMWEEDPATNLEIVKEKSKSDNEEYHRITSTDTIIAIIEDHTQQLSLMKSSAFYKNFDDKIDFWDSNIAQITETLETLMNVQSKWMYLESIFKGQDLAKQLPGETATFTKIDIGFKLEMTRVNKEKNCYRALIGKGQEFLKFLVEQLKKLEDIQKSLQQFLNSKKGQFPRFYFVSDEDLLELIGQAKDPKTINKHIKKMFEGVHELEFELDQGQTRGAQKSYTIVRLKNLIGPPEGELIDLGQAAQIQIDAQIEKWLEKLRNNIMDTMRREFHKYATAQSKVTKQMPSGQLVKNISSNCGQVVTTMFQIEWTGQVDIALRQFSTSTDKNPLKNLKGVWKKKTDTLIECIKLITKSVDREKVITMITLEEHNREVIQKLFENKSVTDEKHFEWQSQLRFYRIENDAQTETQSNQMQIKCNQLNSSFDYGCEYQGNNGRLVVTPLTDRAYMTLTNALQLYRGGAPQGPAGTGKTETVKDLGKNLAFYVVILNCSDQLDHLSMGNFFSGLAMAGAWGCFDEFNRILLDVLSVVAGQVQAILEAQKKGEKKSTCVLNDKDIEVDRNCGLFITMNPGYAGRSELPDNLANLFRPVAMMVPDFQTICKISLMSEGFFNNEVLAKKVFTVYELMRNQLSKQSHYDFAMRSIKSVLRTCGRIKSQQPNLDESNMVIKAIRDMNLPKFTAEDVVLFDCMFQDLFPDNEEPEVNTDELQMAIEDCLIKQNMQLNENLIVKCMQLYESKVTRHGNMLVGLTQSGKTSCWQILCDALNLLDKQQKEANVPEKDQKFKPVKTELINPKSINVDELYGFMDTAGGQQTWKQGILSDVMKQMCADVQTFNRWMVLDGPVDTLWIETMNSVLDDSKLLTLTNGDRVGLTTNVRLLFEVQDLAVASPATVSRAGMIYMDIDELGWKPFFEQWIKSKEKTHGLDFAEKLNELTQKWAVKVLQVKKTVCKELVPSNENACMRSLTRLFDECTKSLQKGEEESREDFLNYIEKWFVFSLIWSVGATVNEQSRKEIDNIMRDIEAMFPHTNTVFEYYINQEKKDWSSWEDKLSNVKPKGKEFHEIMVQTIDTVRNRYICEKLVEKNSQILFIGESGVGKTVLVEGVLGSLDSLIMTFVINFSAGSSSEGLQGMIESYYDRRAKNKFKPKNSKTKAVCFIDDLNMPRKDTYGSQPPLELIRQHIDYQFWYSRSSSVVTKNYICDLQIISAMGKPGGGRAEITPRLVSQFHTITYTIPSEQNMLKIFYTIAFTKFQSFFEEVKSQCEPLAQATINIFNQMSDQFLPTPAKSHYIFNMRDISKVFQGMYKAEKDYYESKEIIVKLWCHEILRVFHDRLIDFGDQQKMKQILDDQLNTIFQMNYKEHCTTHEQDAIFVNFLADNYPDTAIYEEVTDMARMRQRLVETLEKYNTQPKVQKMDIVLFKDAIIHVSKIIRVINLKRGHSLQVGVGGSGRHSLTRLSSFLAGMNCDQLEIKKDFNLKDFRNKLREMYELSAYRDKLRRPLCFIFSDNDVTQETFLEDIQNMLNSGIVPNIYTAEDMGRIRDEGQKMYKQQGNTNESPDAINEWFFNKVKDNMHLAILMSPIGDSFRNYCRQYPALINNTTINWFMPWPEEALIEVAQKFLSVIDLPDEKVRQGLARVCGFTHTASQIQANRMQKELKRVFYVTPTNFIVLLDGYSKMLTEKRKEIGDQANKLRNGLSKLEEAREEVKKMTAEADIKKVRVTEAATACDILIANAEKESIQVNQRQKVIDIDTIAVIAETKQANIIKEQADRELKKAEPALQSAQDAVSKLDKKYISEIKAMNNPPRDVATVMSAVMVFLKKPKEWASVKKELNDPSFVKTIQEFDKENISANVLKEIEKFTKEETFNFEYVSKKSFAAGCLCQWVCAIEDYAKALKIVNPKREQLARAQALVDKLTADLNAKAEELNILKEKLANLVALKEEKERESNQLKADLSNLTAKIDRGSALISGLQSEQIRWLESLVTLDLNYSNLIGDCMISAAFMSYCGPFPSDYRKILNKDWLGKVKEQLIPFNKSYEFSDFMAEKATVREWQTQGLPTDDFSTENACFVTKGERWALNIDPQTQASEWIKKMHEKRGIVIADLKDKDYLKKVELCITNGKVLLLADVGENLDPSLDKLLSKSFIQVSKKQRSVRIGDRELDYHNNFFLYITTRMPNPNYTPEISTKVNVVNFTVKESGLEEQCLGIVISSELPSLEITKNEKLRTIADGKKKLVELEDKILHRLVHSPVALLEDIELVQTLNESKETSAETDQSIDQAETVLKRINDQREVYRACGRKAAALFFVLSDLSKIDPMYQFSLRWYKDLFKTSIEESKEIVSQDRQEQILKVHKQNVYIKACQSLFERHKLLLSLQMLVKLQMGDGQIKPEEYSFFLRGGTVLDRKSQPPKPQQDWISQQMWDHVTELEKTLPETFTGLPAAINLNPKEWHHWFSSDKPEPEDAQLPGEWETKCEDAMKKMIILRCFRPDRVNFAIRNYVVVGFKDQLFIQSRPLSIAEIYESSKPDQPVIFLLVTGVDPTETLLRYSEEKGVKLNTLSLGKGQQEKAVGILNKCAKEGEWCFLSNCHLCINLLPELESILDVIYKSAIKDTFRLFLSASSDPQFPISLLQRSLKIAQEPPRSIKSNMLRLYANQPKNFTTCEKHREFRKAVYGLSWFHTILIERKKFKTLGWNVAYAFNDSDYQVCEDTIANYCGRLIDSVPVNADLKGQKINWQAIQYLIAEANYGGRITDDRDRRLIKVYAKEIFDEALVAIDKWRPQGTDEYNYQYPADEAGTKAPDLSVIFTPQFFQEEITKHMQSTDPPAAYGQHTNAEITSQILDSTELLQSIISLQPAQTSQGGGNADDAIIALLQGLASSVPQEIDLMTLKYKLSRKKEDKENPLNVVLMQEIQRYNILLGVITKSLEQLEKGVKGFVLISPELEAMLNSINQNVVPKDFSFAYFSQKPLAGWFEDLKKRYEFFSNWANSNKGAPYVQWISAYTYPTGFTTALLQKFARKDDKSPSIDRLEFDFIPNPRPENDIQEHAKDGAYVKGLYLEGGKWNLDKQCLMEPEVMELACAMPVMHFKPKEKKGKALPGIYECPCYYYPSRGAQGSKDSFQMRIDLKTGDQPPEFWIKRGTALLMSLA